MRVAAYYRVSSDKQKKAQTIESQRTAARALCAARGWELVAEFTDDGASARAGKLHKRPGFAAMLAGARAHDFAAVILVAFDRLTRSADLGEMGAILGTLQAAGVVVVSDGGAEIDLNTFGGRLTALVRAQLAAEESEVKADRSRRGRDRVASAGRPPCPPPWGLHYDRASGTWAEGDGAATVREAWARSAAGESNVAIAVAFHQRGLSLPRRGKWHPASVARILRNDVYVSGKWQANHDVVIDVPALVDTDTALAARATLKRNRTSGPKTRRGVYLLEGLATCADCGSPMRINGYVSRGHVYRYYVCDQVRRSRFYGADRCTARMQRIDRVDERVWAAVSAWLARPDLISEFLQERGEAAGVDGKQALADLAGWHIKLAAVPALEAEALRLRETGLLSLVALETRLGDLMRRREVLERQIQAAEVMARSAHLEAADVAALEATLEELRGKCSEATPEQKRDLVRALCPDGWTVSPTVIEAEAVFCPGVGSGNAFVNRNQSINVRLDAVPVNGQIHIRDIDEEERERSRVRREARAVNGASNGAMAFGGAA